MEQTNIIFLVILLLIVLYCCERLLLIVRENFTESLPNLREIENCGNYVLNTRYLVRNLTKP